MNNNLIKSKEKIYHHISTKNIINEYHASYNHYGRDNIFENILNGNWFWLRIKKDIEIYIELCPHWNTGNRFKQLKGENKIIIENGPHYRYVEDIWALPTEIANVTNYKYILDIVDHFSKWYNGYLLYTIEAKKY